MSCRYDNTFRAVFIRAPAIMSIGENVSTVATQGTGIPLVFPRHPVGSSSSTLQRLTTLLTEPLAGTMGRRVSQVEVLGKYALTASETQEAQGVEEVIVAVREGKLMATAFHPEITSDPRW